MIYFEKNGISFNQYHFIPRNIKSVFQGSYFIYLLKIKGYMIYRDCSEVPLSRKSFRIETCHFYCKVTSPSVRGVSLKRFFKQNYPIDF